MKDPGHTMDRLYRFQRYFYDATRPFLLLGRDALLDRLDVTPGIRVLEMGCGTARNLIALAKRRHDVELFGVDASGEMLRSARRSIRKAGYRSRITVARCLAEEVDPEATFGLNDKFDRVFFSYSLSMIPSWKAALDAGFRNLKQDGTLHVVDFWDQAKWPRPLRAAMIKWLDLFHVRFERGMLDELKQHYQEIGIDMEITSILSGYAFLTELKTVKF